MTTAIKSVKKHVWDWAELEAAIKAGKVDFKITDEGKDNAAYIERNKYASQNYVQLCDRVFAIYNGRMIELHYMHRIPGSSTLVRMPQVQAFPGAQGRTMYEIRGKQMNWFRERYLPEMESIKKQKNGYTHRIFGQKGVYQYGDGPVYEYAGLSPDEALLPKAIEMLRSYGANDAMMQAASTLGGQLEEKVAPYRDCVLRYYVQKEEDDMYFAALRECDEVYRRHRNGKRHDSIRIPATMVFDAVLYHPRRVYDAGRGYGSTWVEPPAMRVGVCMVDQFSDAETRPLFHINSVMAGHVDHQVHDEDFPLLDVMLTQHMHKLWTPVTEWLAQNVYVPGV